MADSVESRVAQLADVSVSDIATRYKMAEELGSGAQATVYKATHKKTNAKVAVKILESKELEDDELFEALRMEITLLRQLKHPHVVTLLETVRDDKNIYLVQECLGGGELFEQLLAKGPFKEDYALAIFAQVALGIDYMHSLDVVHRDLKAENLVFTAKGSPVIKFIDFGGACTWTADEGLTGLVGTPQYVAPEVVTGYGDDSPTEVPYGKPCDLWSMGVLLYVMLSKTMPFRAKEVDQLLKQVVRGRFHFRPEERWRHVSAEAKDLITKLLTTDPAKRLNIAQVKQHPWAADAIAKCKANMPKLESKTTKLVKTGTGGLGIAPAAVAFKELFKKPTAALAESSVSADREASSSRRTAEAKDSTPKPKEKVGTEEKRERNASRSALSSKKKGGVSREQQYWYAMEISPPTDMQQLGGVKVSKDGTFQMDNVPPEMRAMLADIQKKKAAAEKIALSPSPSNNSAPSTPNPPPGPPPTPPPCPPSGGPPPLPGVSSSAEAQEAQLTHLTTQNEAMMRHASQSDVMDTLLLMGEKDKQIAHLQEVNDDKEARLEELQHQIKQLQKQLQGAAASRESANSIQETSIRLQSMQLELGGAQELTVAAQQRAEQAESELDEQATVVLKLQAKLGAVTTLYSEAMQREAACRVMLEHVQAQQDS